MNNKTKEALIEYVTEQHLTAESKKLIYDFCKNQPSQNIILYRAHNNSKEIRPSLWFSTSLSKELVQKEFAGNSCCIFKIHIENVPVIDINDYIGDEIGAKYNDEKEYIVLGGGFFYQDELHTNKGFLDKGNGNFECWYSLLEPENKTKKKYIQFISRIFD
mgnify:CR=1 FL=1